MDVFGTPKYFASNSMIALFALPRSGGAVTWTRIKVDPSDRTVTSIRFERAFGYPDIVNFSGFSHGV
jgi:hypothetical protein